MQDRQADDPRDHRHDVRDPGDLLDIDRLRANGMTGTIPTGPRSTTS